MDEKLKDKKYEEVLKLRVDEVGCEEKRKVDKAEEGGI